MAEEAKPSVKMRVTKVEDQKRLRGERYRRVYTNNMNVEFSSWDASLVFGEIMESSGTTVEEIVHVTMSHAFLKAVLDTITKNIAAFEGQFGEIQAPLLSVILGAGKNAEADPSSEQAPAPTTKTESE